MSLADILAEKLGTTSNMRHSGWLLPNGQFLDMKLPPGRAPKGAYSTHLAHDDALEKAGVAERTAEALHAGLIRVVPDGGGINVYQQPTSAQRRSLGRWIAEFKGGVDGIYVDMAKEGDQRSEGYPSGVTPEKVLLDIDNFFEGRPLAPVSRLAAFRDHHAPIGALVESLVTCGAPRGELTTIEYELLEASDAGGWARGLLEWAIDRLLQTTTTDAGVLGEGAKPEGKGPRLGVMCYQSPKTIKGEKKGVVTGILYLSPGHSSGRNICPKASGQLAWQAGERLLNGEKPEDIEKWLVQYESGPMGKEAKLVQQTLRDAVKTGASPEAMVALLSTVGGCVGACLGMYSGRGQFDKTRLARIRRTRRLFDPEKRTEFLQELEDDIQRIEREAQERGMQPGIRLNGTSDIDWRKRQYWHGNASFFDRHPNIQFYDYTKDPNLMQAYLDAKRGMGGDFPKNLHVTYSFNGFDDWARYKQFLDRGGNVALAMRIKHNEPKPLRWDGYRVVDGDVSDVRFLDDKEQEGERGVVVMLSAKGRSYNLLNPLLVNPYDPRAEWPKSSQYHPDNASKAQREEFAADWRRRNEREALMRQAQILAGRWYSHMVASAMGDEQLDRDFAVPLIERLAEAEKGITHAAREGWAVPWAKEVIRQYRDTAPYTPQKAFGERGITPDVIKKLAGMLLSNIDLRIKQRNIAAKRERRKEAAGAIRESCEKLIAESKAHRTSMRPSGFSYMDDITGSMRRGATVQGAQDWRMEQIPAQNVPGAKPPKPRRH